MRKYHVYCGRDGYFLLSFYVYKSHALAQTIAIYVFHSARTIRVTKNDRRYHSATLWFSIIS